MTDENSEKLDLSKVAKDVEISEEDYNFERACQIIFNT
jgi:hypothetical protein